MKKFCLSVMCLLLTFVFVIFPCKVIAAALTDNPNVAVLPYKNKAAIPKKIALKDASLVSEFVMEQLIDTKRFRIIEREALEDVAKELNYSMSGLVDPETAVQSGKQKGVQFLIAGSVTGLSTTDSGFSFSDSELATMNLNKMSVVANITARFIDVETGEVVMFASGTGKSSRTNAEIYINKKYYEDYETTSEIDPDNPDVDENTDVKTREFKLKIGSDSFNQVQVRNALYKAVGDLIYNKDYGILAKLDAKITGNHVKRRKV